MNPPRTLGARSLWHRLLRKIVAFLPREWRFTLYRSFIDCDPRPDPRLSLQIAQTQEELEACFKLLHDAYVASGFMQPDPSGMRLNIYHALPSTTTLCAKFDGEVVGTISLIRESVFGFPLQSIFDLRELRDKRGRLAEVSALAVHPKFRRSGGMILFPLMKFMYDYCTTFFDTRHLVIAVHPNRIEMYESLLFFERLSENPVANYAFANGAPAVGATLDLRRAPEIFKRIYGKKPRRKNLFVYFVRTRLPNIMMPGRRYFSTNDPVMTPALLDYFFNQRTSIFARLGERDKSLLHSIYNLAPYQAVLPALSTPPEQASQHQRMHQRYSLKCPGNFYVTGAGNAPVYALQVVELSDQGFLAHSKVPLPLNACGQASIRLGSEEISVTKAVVAHGKHQGGTGWYGFKLLEADLAWRKLVSVLKAGSTHDDLEHSSRFLPD